MSDCKLLNVLEVPGILYDTARGYPAAVFDEKSQQTVCGELYIMGNPSNKLKELDEVESVDTSLFKRVPLNHREIDFYSYGAGSLLQDCKVPQNKITEGNWRRFSSLSFHDPISFALNFEDRQKYLYREAISPNAEGSVYIRGDLPILVSAPHASVHERMGKLKRQEFYTGALSVLMHALTGCHTLYTNRLMKSDPNYNDDSPYKAKLTEIVKTNEIKFLIDLHGTGSEREHDIYPGVGISKEFLLSNDNFMDGLESEAALNDISVGGLDIFPAAKQMTVTKYAARELGVPSIQLEINRRLRQPEKTPQEFIKLVKFLRDFIEKLSYLIS
ncbi:MAG: hypothetical protein DHS20C13_09960 [Thermodesulfobacteriota bacterium]|nr:MAG: hypothetical protein DHS20C13_09960 [Thermodesulfobacteriota bacterium]